MEVGREPGDKDCLETTLSEVATETGRRLMIGLEECGIAVHILVIAFPEQELSVRNCELLGKIGPWRQGDLYRG